MSNVLLAVVLITSILVNMSKNAHIQELRAQLEECTKHTNPNPE